MKTIVITGSARGFGFAMMKDFYLTDEFNAVLLDVSEENLKIAKDELSKLNKKGKILSYVADVTNIDSIHNVIENVKKEIGSIDIWINNAGVNQKMNPVWDVDEKTISRLIDIDLKGTILCSKEILSFYKEQGHGQIYNVEGFGSNDAYQVGLSIYGTSKRAVTYFTKALAYEVDKEGLNVQVGKITPGIMITNFINHNLGEGEAFSLPEKTKKVYNILGDYPETIAAFMVKRILKNTKNNAKFTWLTNRKAFFRFMKAPFSKRDFFKEETK